MVTIWDASSGLTRSYIATEMLVCVPLTSDNKYCVAAERYPTDLVQRSVIQLTSNHIKIVCCTTSDIRRLRGTLELFSILALLLPVAFGFLTALLLLLVGQFLAALPLLLLSFLVGTGEHYPTDPTSSKPKYPNGDVSPNRSVHELL